MIALKEFLFILGIIGRLLIQNANATPLEASQKELQKQQSPKNILKGFNSFEKERLLKNLKSKTEQAQSRVQKKKEKRAANRFLVKRIQVSQSRILTQKEIRSVTQKYEGRYLSLLGLMQIVQKINFLYENKVGGLSRAVLPPQKIKNGLVRIILVENKIGEVIFKGINRTSLSYLHWALPLQEDKAMNLKKLEQILINFNKTHQSIKVTSSLTPGKQFSETNMTIQVKELAPYKLNSFFDNHGAESTGALRYGLTFQSNSYFGIDDQLTLGLTKASGSMSSFASYDVPLGRWGTRIKALYSTSRQHLVGGSFAELKIKGKSSFFSGKVTQPLFVTRTLKIQTTLAIDYHVNKNTVVHFDSENKRREYVSEIHIQKYDSKGGWALDAGFHRILKIDLMDNVSGQRQWYKKWLTSLTRYQLLSRDFTMVAKVTGQHTPDSSLPVSHQFQLGGTNNLSYESSQFSGDKGQSAEIELQYDVSWENSLRPLLSNADIKIYGSLQWGRVSESNFHNSISAESISLGLNARLTSWGTLKITMATPLRDRHPKTNKRHFLLSFHGNF